MMYAQTVEIPADRRIVIDVPQEIPAGARARVSFVVEDVCPLCAKYYDPKTGQPPYNAETMAAIAEGDAMLRGEIPAVWHESLDDLDEILGL
jgi:hypothetical protein